MVRLTLRYPGHAIRSELRFERGGIARLGAFTSRTTGARRVLVVTDRRVERLYAPVALRSLRAAGLAARLHAVPPGERSKSASRLAELWDALARADVGRGDAVVALGGGVVGDLAGFAAATWLRGVAWIGVPTTLLAQVDSSVGGKTAVDVPAGKNLAGAFHQPAGVLLDTGVLATLPVRHRRAGLAEVVKTGFAVEAPLFRWLERNAPALAAGEPDALEEAVRRSVRAKARVVMADEREREGGARTALNLGHTLGHAIESVLGYRGLLHGEAVALGLRAVAHLSQHEAGLESSSVARLNALLDAFGLPRRMPPVPVRSLFEAMQHDKKRGRAGVRWVLTPRIGVASVPRVVATPFVRAVLLAAGARG
jgi:3-dehydroquinate synthase